MCSRGKYGARGTRTDLQLSLDPVLAAVPVLGLGSVIFGHYLHELPGKRRVLGWVWEDRHRESGSQDGVGQGGSAWTYGRMVSVSLRASLQLGPRPSRPTSSVLYSPAGYRHPLPKPAVDPKMWLGSAHLYNPAQPLGHAPRLWTFSTQPTQLRLGRLSSPSRCHPSWATASYLGLADAQVRRGTVQSLLLLDALLDRCEREDAVRDRKPGACRAGVPGL